MINSSFASCCNIITVDNPNIRRADPPPVDPTRTLLRPPLASHSSLAVICARTPSRASRGTYSSCQLRFAHTVGGSTLNAETLLAVVVVVGKKNLQRDAHFVARTRVYSSRLLLLLPLFLF